MLQNGNDRLVDGVDDKESGEAEAVLEAAIAPLNTDCHVY
jgi:hypothetical protein